ncbi:hypothetical protein, partial [Rhodococcus sp. BH5]|uniref:hypothetical protein n=1 Tax=Rhodococcus sp. BH5 TaxID=2871702 RepID=UPI0022CDA09E
MDTDLRSAPARHPDGAHAGAGRGAGCAGGVGAPSTTLHAVLPSQYAGVCTPIYGARAGINHSSNHRGAGNRLIRIETVRRGLSSIGSAELAAARRRIAELETELAIAKRSTELLKSVAAA